MPNKMNVKQGIRRNFARRAATYDRYAGVQQFMARELLGHCNPEVMAAQDILEIGCGTGYLTAKIWQLNPKARMVAVDLDEALIRLAQTRQTNGYRVEWVVADAETLGPGRFDVIISNSTFQWFTSPRETLRRYFASLNQGGCLAFAVMGPATYRELAASLAATSRELNFEEPYPIAASGFLGREAWTRLLAETGFAPVELRHQLIAVSFPGVLEFLKAIQATGATNPEPRPLSPAYLRRLVASYKAGFGNNGSIPATYEVIWVKARKARGQEGGCR
jgi:malonyl-CoA O-methyltransferase